MGMGLETVHICMRSETISIFSGREGGRDIILHVLVSAKPPSLPLLSYFFPFKFSPLPPSLSLLSPSSLSLPPSPSLSLLPAWPYIDNKCVESP